jgi:transcription elongation factor Elf1
MSFLEEQRRQILEENNTAQSEFLDILEHLAPTETVIDVRTPLSGDLDLSVLEKCNFTGITTIWFSPGNITSLKGVPKGVTKLVCASNYLTEINSLPDSLVDLDLRQNAIKSVEGLPQGLKELNLSDNQIHALAELPKDLEVLRCENNRMKTLKLDGIENLRILKCGNNPLLVIESVPDTLQEFDTDTDVVTEIRRTDKEGIDHENVSKKANYMECIHTFYELKRLYEERVRKIKRDIFKSSKSKKEAKMKMALLKPKCLYCERPVGSVFKIEKRTFTARCGDSSHPCAFHIELFGGEYSRVSEMLDKYRETVELIKQEIIVDKLDVLYRFITERDGVNLFKDNLDFFTNQSVHMANIKKEYEELYFSEEIDEKVKQKNAKILSIQDRISELIQEYKNTENPEIIRDAMTLYDRELVPEINNLQLIRWQTREIIQDEKTGVFELFQRNWRLGQVEYTFGEYPRVVHFKVHE